jgi:threonine 3-dehydrogenase
MMLAIVKRDRGPGLEMNERPMPSAGTGDVVVAVALTGICGTDVHIGEWDQWARANVVPPVVIGHEFSGVIHEVGAGVENLKTGDRVTGEGHIGCGECAECRRGDIHLCRTAQLVGVNRDGAFAEYIVVPASSIRVLPDGVSLEIGALLDPLGNAVHALSGLDVEGLDVLVSGLGPIGQITVAVLAHRKAGRIFVTDIKQGRLERAVASGATDAFLVGEGASGIRGEIVDLAIETSGTAGGFGDCARGLRPRGRLRLVGLPGASGEHGLSTVISKMLDVRGVSGRQVIETWQESWGLLADGLDLAGLVTSTFAAQDWRSAFQDAPTAPGKVQISWP